MSGFSANDCNVTPNIFAAQSAIDADPVLDPAAQPTAAPMLPPTDSVPGRGRSAPIVASLPRLPTLSRLPLGRSSVRLVRIGTPTATAASFRARWPRTPVRQLRFRRRRSLVRAGEHRLDEGQVRSADLEAEAHFRGSPQQDLALGEDGPGTRADRKRIVFQVQRTGG